MNFSKILSGIFRLEVPAQLDFCCFVKIKKWSSWVAFVAGCDEELLFRVPGSIRVLDLYLNAWKVVSSYNNCTHNEWTKSSKFLCCHVRGLLAVLQPRLSHIIVVQSNGYQVYSRISALVKVKKLVVHKPVGKVVRKSLGQIVPLVQFENIT